MKKLFSDIGHRFYIGLILSMFLVSLIASSGNSVRAVDCPDGSVMSVVAHEDDDLLFQNPDLWHDIQNGKCVRTVFVTAGDAGWDANYWLGREAGAKAAYASMAGVANLWQEIDAGVPGHPIPVFTMTNHPTVSLTFLRLPDGNGEGGGFAATNNTSLQKLWLGSISELWAVNGTSGYTKPQLIATLLALMNGYQPDELYTQDFNGVFGDGDHSDHHTASYFARAAHQQFANTHGVTAYQGYGISSKPENVSGPDWTAKKNAFYAYGAHDFVCTSDEACGTGTYAQWLLRQYTTRSENGGSGAFTNIAPSSVLTTSSESPWSDQLAGKAVDGFATGYPTDHTKEWATWGGKAGSWLKLVWPQARTINKIVLHDRPNSTDQITSADIRFNVGGTIATMDVGALNNDGTGVTLNFPNITATSVKLVIKTVSGTTQNIGLSEIEVFAAP